jgi:hypothetical protein
MSLLCFDVDDFGFNASINIGDFSLDAVMKVELRASPLNLAERMLRLYSYLGFTRFAYASYLPYMYDRTVLTVYRTHLGLCRYLDT